MLQEKRVDEFMETLASNAPVPGGGSVAALSGALAAALTEMVASLTVGKAKYAESEKEMQEILIAFSDYREAFLRGMDEDAQAFHLVMDALSMPKETDDQKSVRKEAMQNAFKEASRVPLETARLGMNLFPGIQVVVERGNQNAASDGLVAAMMARNAILSALLNVRINLQSIKDENFVIATRKEVLDLERQAIAQEAEILKLAQF
ncbi:cyclodeaminase/cyclohydrolase family protein [Gottschalkiaceae bacterium SANA]|nr:cyclodeaminase/cyclohydrolase family protein [Gottschalkiaceae bacterium SANA]